jgi:hypothetical protein
VKNCKDYFGNTDSWDMFLAGCNELWCANVCQMFEIDPVELKIEPILHSVDELFKKSQPNQKMELVLKLKTIVDDEINLAALEPSVAKTKGRPRNSKNKKVTHSTKRDPSGFEYLEYWKEGIIKDQKWVCDFPGCISSFKLKMNGDLSVHIQNHIKGHLS